MKSAFRCMAVIAALVAGSASAQPYVLGGIGTDSTLAIGAGYQATNNFGAEVSYFSTKDDELSKLAAETVRVKGFGFYGTGTLPIAAALSLVGKLGLHRVEGGEGFNKAADLGGKVSSDGDAEWVLGAGLGLRYAVNERLAARAMVEHTDGKAGIPSTDLITVQALFSF